MVVILLFAVLSPAAHVPIPKNTTNNIFLIFRTKVFFFANVLISYNIDFDLILNIHVEFLTLYLLKRQQKKILFSPLFFFLMSKCNLQTMHLRLCCRLSTPHHLSKKLTQYTKFRLIISSVAILLLILFG